MTDPVVCRLVRQAHVEAAAADVDPISGQSLADQVAALTDDHLRRVYIELGVLMSWSDVELRRHNGDAAEPSDEDVVRAGVALLEGQPLTNPFLANLVEPNLDQVISSSPDHLRQLCIKDADLIAWVERELGFNKGTPFGVDR
jgi:hypothetical protein